VELKFKGQFNRDIDIANRELLEEVKNAILNVKAAKSVSQIAQLKKLRKYKTHYRIKISEHYRIGIVIRKEVVWFACFGHRNTFYKSFP
jgi:mRNA interferase RelE/StbE